MAVNDKERKNISQHILPTSANLLGLCFLILSLKKLWKGDGLANFMDKLGRLFLITVFPSWEGRYFVSSPR